MCKYLLEFNAAINLKTKYNNTALYLVVKYKKYDICKILLKHGADVNYKNSDVLDTANATNDTRIILLINKYGKKNVTKYEQQNQEYGFINKGFSGD